MGRCTIYNRKDRRRNQGVSRPHRSPVTGHENHGLASKRVRLSLLNVKVGALVDDNRSDRELIKSGTGDYRIEGRVQYRYYNAQKYHTAIRAETNRIYDE